MGWDPKKWVGLGNWMSMVFKNEKPIKNYGKSRLKPNKLTYPIISTFSFLFHWEEGEYKIF